MGKKIITIAGINCEGGMEYARELVGQKVYAMSEPTNKYDNDAVEVVDILTHHIA